MTSEEKTPILSEEKSHDDRSHWYSREPFYWLYEHRSYIPGHGMYSLIRKGKVYSLYVLMILLLAYLLNQLDRYTLSSTAKYIGQDLHFGDIDCMPNLTTVAYYNLSRRYYAIDLMKACNKNQTYLQNESLCLDYVHTLPNNETVPVCGWDHDGSTGILYQVLAGPVFNNLYPLAGIIMGILADKFNRKILLGLSLLFWSVATGLTGFSQYYWMLVVFRMLLAIGAAGCTPFAVSLIADYFPQELRGTALGIYYWGIYIGYSFSYALGNQINIALNWRWVFFISGLMGIALVPLVLFTVKEPSRADKDEKKEEPIYRVKNCGEFLLKLKESGKKILSKEFAIKQLKLVLLLLKTLFLPGMLTLIIAGAIRNAGGYVWAYNTQPFFSMFVSDDIISIYMTAIPLVGGCIGSIVGGIISDTLVKNRGTYARIWVLIFSQILAAPFAAGALFLPYPWCFLTLIPSNVIGEMWVGVLSAIVVDISPSQIRTTVIATYLFIITVIGGNINVIVDPLKKAFIDCCGSYAYRWALLITFPGFYVLSSVLFLLAFFVIRLDIKMKAKSEQKAMSLNRPEKSGSAESIEA